MSRFPPPARHSDRDVPSVASIRVYLMPTPVRQFLVAATLAVTSALLPPVAGATTFTVNTTSDTTDGTCDAAHCSLREALAAAQSAAGTPHVIQFAIPGAGVQTITVGSALPFITQSVTIDGYTQPGSSPNTSATGGINAVPLIEVRGNASVNFGLLVLTSGAVTIRGIVASGFALGAINLANGTLTVAGSFVGTTADGTAAASATAGSGILLNAGVAVIGGTAPADRNVISGNSTGISVALSPNSGVQVTVHGNLVGLNKAGTGAVANRFDGYQSLGCNGGNADGRIGGTTAAQRNVFSGNGRHGVAVTNCGVGTSSTANGSFVTGNFIGTDATGTAAVPNLGSGVEVANGPGVRVGGTAPGEANVIAFNGGRGVAVFTISATNTSVLSNRIFANGNLGIDIDGNGVTANDAGDADTLRQNFPVITQVAPSGGSTTIQGTLASTANGTFRLQFFRNDATDAASHGEGQTPIGELTNVTTDASGNAAFSITVPVAIGPTEFVTATATDSAGNTSEFSELTADLALTHADSPDPVGVNQDVTHALTVANPSTAFPSGPVVLTYTLAAGATFVSATGGVVPSGGTVTFNLGTVAAGGSAQRAVVVRHPTTGAKTSTATVTSTVNDPSAANNTAAATTTVSTVVQTFTISGQVRDLNDTGVADVTMTLSGSASATLATDADGNYAFTGLAPGGTYTVTPSRATFTFDPPSQTFPNLSADQVAAFFVAAAGADTHALEDALRRNAEEKSIRSSWYSTSPEPVAASAAPRTISSVMSMMSRYSE